MAKRRPVFIWGAPGVGKSEVVAQVAHDAKLDLRDVRLSLLDPVDLKGFPTVDPVKKLMRWLPPDFLPTKGKGILFLDEMNSAPQSVQAAAFQLILNRRIGNYELPSGWAILAAGNRSGDRSVVHAMPSALANRFVHLDFDVNHDDWNQWAIQNQIHSDIRAFLRFRSHLLHSFDSASNPVAFPSPRSWSFVNDIYQSNHSADTEFELIKGTVGEGAAVEFVAFLRSTTDLPTVEQVLQAPLKAKMPANPSAKYAMVTALDGLANTANISNILAYIGRMPVEFQVVFVRSVIRRDRSLIDTPAYRDWAIENHGALV